MGKISHGAGQLAERHFPRAARRRAKFRFSSVYQPATLNPNVIGSPWTPWLRPMSGVLAWVSANRFTGHHQFLKPDHQEVETILSSGPPGPCPKRPRR
jgi:hypothetical protein